MFSTSSSTPGFAGFPSRQKSFQGVFRFEDVSDAVQNHLKLVYSTLLTLVTTASLGAMMSLNGMIFVTPMITFFGSFAALFWYLSQPRIPSAASSRLFALSVFSFLQGLSLAPLLSLSLSLSPSLPLQALLGTLGVFGCFSLAALLSKRRSALMLGGVLGGALSVLALVRLVALFTPMPMYLPLELYGGLVIFSLYVMYDTQMMIYQAEMSLQRGETPDHLHASLELFIDLIAIFVRILIILMKNAAEKKEKKRSR